MGELVGVFSSGMVMDNARYVGDAPSRFIKRAAIMSDLLFMDTQGLSRPGPEQDDWVYAVFAEPRERDFLRASKEFREIFLRPQDIGDDRDVILTLYDNPWNDDNPDNIWANAYEVANIFDEHGLFARDWHPYKARGALAMQLSHDLRLPIRCQRWFDSPVAILNPLHRSLVARLTSPSSTPDPLSGIGQLEHCGVVDFGDLSWEDVFALRKSRFWRNFRARMEDIAASEVDPSAGTWSDLWRYVGETFPKLGKASIVAMVTCLPFPGAPIAGFAASARDVADAMRTRDDFGWLYFLFEARRKQHRDLHVSDDSEERQET